MLEGNNEYFMQHSQMNFIMNLSLFFMGHYRNQTQQNTFWKLRKQHDTELDKWYTGQVLRDLREISETKQKLTKCNGIWREILSIWNQDT